MVWVEFGAAAAAGGVAEHVEGLAEPQVFGGPGRDLVARPGREAAPGGQDLQHAAAALCVFRRAGVGDLLRLAEELLQGLGRAGARHADP